MAENNKEKVSDKSELDVELLSKLDWINSQIVDLLRSEDPQMRNIGELLLRMLSVISGEFSNVWDEASEALKAHNGLVDVHNKLTTHSQTVTMAIANIMSKLEGRVSELENKVKQPNPELANLKVEVAKTQESLGEHKNTLDELEVMRQNKFQKWIQALEKGKGKQ